MISSFIPAGEILGPECQVRTIVLADDPYLPSGSYSFLDTYCVDNSCDCRKTMIQVFHEDHLVSIVNFGWEKPEFYLRWLNSAEERELAEAMSGVSVDITSPDRVSAHGILLLMEHLLDEKWISLLKEHYRLIRATSRPNNIIRMPRKISRNAPCPCGSGKKFKNCCL